MAPDLAPATTRTAAVVRAVRDDQLGLPTPCDIGVGDLLDHLRTRSLAFTAAATKADDEITKSPPPPPDAANLGDGWRDHIAGLLDRLALAWADPAASEGMTKAGGLELPGEVAGVIGLDEVVLHGWDLAVATGQAYDVEDESLEPLLPFLVHVSEPGMEAGRAGLFGSVVPVADDAPLFDRVLGLAGRDPNWKP
jgi:uncharacterized protein (TIGR03086 family)